MTEPARNKQHPRLGLLYCLFVASKLIRRWL